LNEEKVIMAVIAPAEIQKFELFAGFQSDELAETAANLIPREFPRGTVIFAAGDDSRSIYLLLAGKVQIELIGETVEETQLAELGPLDVFGESTFFHAAKHATTARSLEDSQLAEFPYSTYESLLKRRSSVAYHLGANAAHILAARLQSTDAWIRELLEYGEQLHRRAVRERYYGAFRPTFRTPGGFIGLGVNW
jgi:CRP-like cAMP-binding protein